MLESNTTVNKKLYIAHMIQLEQLHEHGQTILFQSAKPHVAQSIKTAL